MDNQIPWDTVLNIVFFAVGFIIGLAQLWQAQRYFLSDQRSKFEQINGAITQIAQRLAVIEGVTNRLIEIDRSLSTIGATSTSLQERLFGIVERQFSIGEQTGQVTLEASDQIKGVIKQELLNSQFVTPDKMSQLEEKVDRVLSEFGGQLFRLAQTNSEHLAPSPSAFAEQLPIFANTPPAVSADPNLLEFGKLRLDKLQQKVWLDEKPLTLSRRTFYLLALFMENPGRILTAEEVARTLYGDDSANVSINNVFMHISRLRREIEHESISLHSVRTTKGRGFALVLTDLGLGNSEKSTVNPNV